MRQTLQVSSSKTEHKRDGVWPAGSSPLSWGPLQMWPDESCQNTKGALAPRLKTGNPAQYLHKLCSASPLPDFRMMTFSQGLLLHSLPAASTGPSNRALLLPLGLRAGRQQVQQSKLLGAGSTHRRQVCLRVSAAHAPAAERARLECQAHVIWSAYSLN